MIEGEKAENYFDKAMEIPSYRNNARNTFSIGRNLSNNFLVDKYADFTPLPFSSMFIVIGYSRSHKIIVVFSKLFYLFRWNTRNR